VPQARGLFGLPHGVEGGAVVTDLAGGKSHDDQIAAYQPRRIYLASSWRNPHQPRAVELLRELGNEVYDFRNPRDAGFAWSSIAPDWLGWEPATFRDLLRHPIAQDGFANDFNAMKWADTFVLLLPSSESGAAANRSNTSVKVGTWDGQRATRCDHLRCENPPVLHVELSSPGCEYAAEADLCEEHLPQLVDQGRAFLVVFGIIQPKTETERNLKAAAGEHL
jgi:hypothetical protein